MLYLILLLLLFGSCFLAHYKPKTEKYLYFGLMGILWLMLMFRYGQGSDYFGYKWQMCLFSTFDNGLLNPPSYYNCEIGFRLLYWIFGGRFELLVAVISCFEMLMLHKFIWKHTGKRLQILTLFYPAFYLIYYFSALRQGVVIAIFLGILYDAMCRKKWWLYLLVCILSASIHSSALLFLLFPVVQKLPIKAIFICLAVALAGGIGFGFYMNAGLPVPFKSINIYWKGSVSVMALLSRTVLIAAALFLYYSCAPEDRTEEITRDLKILLCGYGIYLLFMLMPLIASRCMVCFELIYIILFPRLLAQNKKWKKAAVVFLLLFTSVHTYKNLDSFLAQGSYKEDVSVFEYPYVTIFNKDTLWKYREKDEYVQKLIDFYAKE